MKISSAVRFVKWELTRFGRSLLNFRDLQWKPARSIDLDKLFSEYGTGKDFFFMQVGANDGVSGDYLHVYIEQYKWHGILVEPVPYVFEKLRANYRDNDRLILENAAIGNVNGSQPFFSLAEYDDDGAPVIENTNGFRIDQLGSFDKATILKHAYMHPRLETLIREIKVPAITVHDLLLKYNVNRLDLLQVDTEGFDFEICNNIRFDKVKPRILIFEHHHISRVQYRALVKKLRKNRYDFFINGWDTVCLLKN